MSKNDPSLPEQNYSEDVSLLKQTGRLFKTRILAQLLGIIFVGIALYIPFHHYLPSYREMWYGLRPSDKELIVENSNQMRFVDEKTGSFLIWYETYSDGYRFYDGPGFYGAGRERELADTDEKIQRLKQWVDAIAARKRQTQENLAALEALNNKLTELEKVVREKQNQELASKLQHQNVAPTPVAVPRQVVSNTVTELPVTAVESPAFYKHGAIIPPNPTPLAWFQSLRWGKYPGKPYMFNRNTGFFEMEHKPETRIAPHPHFIARNEQTGLLERPFSIFVRLHGMVPREVQIPSLDEGYYQLTADRLGATFNSRYPYEVTVRGVTY